MKKLWSVVRNEYVRQVFTKGFIAVVLSVPLVLALSIGLGWLIDTIENSKAPIGYVDHAGLLADAIPAPERGSSANDPGGSGGVRLIQFQTEEEARRALEQDDIQAYYVVTAEYFETNRVELVYFELPGRSAQGRFWDFVQINKITDVPADVARRAVAGSDLTVRVPYDEMGGEREFSGQTFLRNLSPMFVGVVFILLLFMSSGYFTQAVAEEKENRTVEIVVTSISPGQLIGGKVLGLTAVTLTQLVVWTAFVVAGVALGRHVLDIEILQYPLVDLRSMVMMVAIGVPTYVMIVALMTAVGSTVAESQEAQQVGALFALPAVVPMWLAPLFVENPDGPLAVALSLFPPTALTTFTLRFISFSVPVWQFILSVVLITLCAAGAIWLAGRAFRVGLLRYGQRVDWRELFLPGHAHPLEEAARE